MNLYHIKDEDEWQQILDDLCQALEMPTALVDTSSFVLQESGERHELCAAIRSKMESLIGICAKTQKFMAKEARETRRPVIVACEANMTKCLIPVFADREFMGSVVVCGTAIPGKEIPSATISESIDLSEDEIKPMITRIPVMDKEKVAQVSDQTFEEIHSGS
ncbi:MAG: PocR ligand-binding domain-containing protein [Deltaproteobacteria bacterium]|nr:PocR ligand-binding domain-containing protein [Deltaproteobacteria bacterium]MBW2047167.1 PocR ligand-binding domain-containing protein [Deltaproteobacteria bacterium]MBW2109844.1 PocR ligand-binding domain-containing protein [Deltaproteobacteria bacterium]MBW2352554.1 PocR ligand-binding domain-containing protein [Deltaproteobacteria bacterium]